MSTFKYLLAAAAVLCRLSQTSACSCASPGTLCDSVLSADVVLHVKALSRTDGASINDDAVYTLETIQVFKGEEPGPNEYDEVGATFEMTTGGNSAMCGVFLDTDGTEYLIDMDRLGDGTLYATGICGLIREWSEEDRATLEAGCADYDPCDGECGEFQECVRSFDYYAEVAYYCEDTCDPSPCLDGEACTLLYPSCSVPPCSAEATCGGAEPPSPSSPPPETLSPSGDIGSTEPSYVGTLAPSSGPRGPPTNGDNGSETRPPTPGTVGPPSSQAPRTAAPTRTERNPPGAAPTLPPRGGAPTAPNSSEAPTAGLDSPTSSPTASDGSRGVPTPTTAAPSTTPSPDGGGGGASPLPEVSSAPTVSTNAEGDGNGAAAAVRLSGGFVAATAMAVATAAAACASL